jgi:hypothetical protein
VIASGIGERLNQAGSSMTASALFASHVDAKRSLAFLGRKPYVAKLVEYANLLYTLLRAYLL